MSSELPSTILNISLFGSNFRDDDMPDSDLDILVIVADGTEKTAPNPIYDFIQTKFGKEPSLSWYGLQKVKDLFKTGDLFAWHLHLESKTLVGRSLIEIVGTPSDYRTALSDINALQQIAVNVEDSIRGCPSNAVFEMGILYVCARNIAMAASWHLVSRPSFGRYSTFDLPIQFPIDREMYETMLQSRMASQRGIDPPLVHVDQVLEVQKRLLTWSSIITDTIQKMEIRI